MGWTGYQSYYMSITPDQAAALVTMAEACFGKPGGPSKDGLSSHIFHGTYRTIDDNWVAKITGGRSLRDAGYPHRIVLTADGPRTMQRVLEVAPNNLPLVELVGIVFPFGYHGEYCYQPVSFVFARTPGLCEPDQPWRLMTAVPFTAPWLDATPPEEASNRLWDMGFLHELGDAYWPREHLIQPTIVIGLREGCEVSLSKQNPDWLTGFIYFAQHKLQIECKSVPDVTKSLERDYPRSWEFEFQPERCFNADASRFKFWQEAFSITADA